MWFLCYIAGHTWNRLPPVTPAQIVISRQIQKFFTGNLEAPVSFQDFVQGFCSRLFNSGLIPGAPGVLIIPSVALWSFLIKFVAFLWWRFDPRPYQLISCQIFVSHSYCVSIMLGAEAMELDFNSDQWKLSLFWLNRL